MTSPRQLSPGLCAQAACILEASARKAGNVHRFRDFDDASYIDFLLSAAAIAPALELAPGRGIGETVLDAVERTRRVARSNTNLGIILLLAPLAAAFGEEPLPEAVERRLRAAGVRDAFKVYEAIRLAAPGGLGAAAEEDVRGVPTRPLLEVMRLAADRDLIARQIAGGYREVLERGVPAIAAALAPERGGGLALEEAVISCHLHLLAGLGDSLIARKAGAEASARAAALAGEVLALGWPRGREAAERFEALDRWLRSRGNLLNPGATADLTAASLFLAMRDGIIELPAPFGG